LNDFIKYLYFWLIFFFSINLIISNFENVYSFSQVSSNNIKKQIEICCTWGEKLADGILIYQINNAKPELRELAIAALNYWEQNIEGIKFKEAEHKEQVDIKISFRNDNGKVPGQTITNADSNGFIFNIHILLSEKAFGKQLKKNMIEYIAKHEIGHAFGLGHANFKESIMSALVYHSHNEISDCERKAIAESNKWKLINDSSLPKVNNNKVYFC
jgi:predicted Zn-dependent protease